MRVKENQNIIIKTYVLSFNSSLVRVKALNLKVQNFTITRFNSSLVRVKVKKKFLEPDLELCFNSSLVRVKAGTLKYHLQYTFQFQFQFGAGERLNQHLE